MHLHISSMPVGNITVIRVLLIFYDRSHHKREHSPSPSRNSSKKIRDGAEDLVLREDISKHTRRKRMMLCERFADSDQEPFEPEENITIGL